MKLILEDGTTFEGENFGSPISRTGEVVFNTGMTGYVETLSDPSYAGQILVCTYPLIGNYGVPDKDFFESSKIQVAGLVVNEYSATYSHFDAKQSLSEWLIQCDIPAISGVDTRAITKKLREYGVMLGGIAQKDPLTVFPDPNESNLVAQVSCTQVREYGNGPKKIIAVDCGMKEHIVRSLAQPGFTVVRVPWDYDFTKDTYDALFISNGPGDPALCTPTIAHIKKAMQDSKPILGICLGVQLLALAAGAKTYKLKYGHRSQNQPCIDTTSLRCYITSQNHGFAVAEKSLPANWEVWFKNANDNSIEGIRHSKKPWRAVQFHPEATPGPVDTHWIFDEFLQSI